MVFAPIFGIPYNSNSASELRGEVMYYRVHDPCSTNAPSFFEQRKKKFRERIRSDAFMAMIFSTSREKQEKARKLYEDLKGDT